MNKRSDVGSINAYDIAIDYAAIGDASEALSWLEKSLKARDPKITLIGVEPIFDDLRSSPRFIVMLNRVELKVLRN